jgi:hypothetical protein
MRVRVKKILIVVFAALIFAGSVLAAKNWSNIQADYWLLRTDWAIARTKSWRMHLQTTDPKLPQEWMVIEAVPRDREHGWQHIDRTMDDGDSKSIRIAGDLEYIRIRDERYFRGDAMFGHKGSSQWIRLIPRDFPPLDGFFELRLHMNNPRTIGYSFDSIETSFWSNYHGIQMQPEGVKTYSGHPCLEWSYNWTIEETGRIMSDTVCVGTVDQLPYHLTISGGWAEVSYEWNPQVTVDAPTPVFDRPKGFIAAMPDL